MRVLMLSQNESLYDSRVIREAEALAHRGYDVSVVCRAPVGATAGDERVAGVRYVSIPRTTLNPVLLAALFRAHAEVLWLDATHVVRGPHRPRHARSALRLGALVVIAPFATVAAVPLVFLRRRVGRAGDGLPANRLRRTCRWLWHRWGLFFEPLARKFFDYVEALNYLNDHAGCCTRAAVDLRPDVVHAHDLATLSGASIAARRARARLVYDAHELETHTNSVFTPILKRWVAYYESVLIQRCDAVVTVCDSIADWLEREYRIPRPIVVMNSPLRTRRSAGAGVRTAAEVDDDVPLVIYVGSVTVDRGLELTLEALALLPRVHLATIGPRWSPTEESLRRIASELGVRDRLHFIDPVPSANVVSFIADADASVIPIQNVCLSYAYAFPNKLLESVFARVPVAAADLVEIRRFLELHPVGVIMDETDPSAIANALLRLIEHRAEFTPDEAELGRIDAEYGWDAQDVRLSALYETLDVRLPAPTGDPEYAMSNRTS